MHLRWRCFGSFSGLECSQLGDGRKTNVNDNLIARQELSKSFTPPELYSLCQPKSCLQHNLSSELGMCTQLPQVHGASISLTSKSSLFASSMSSYPNSESLATGSSRNGSRPLHSQGWSIQSSCIFSSVQVSRTNWVKLNICLHTSKSLKQYLWIYLDSPALLRYFENQCHFNCTQLFSYSWSSFSMLRFLVIRLWCAATRSSCIENHWTQYKKLIK